MCRNGLAAVGLSAIVILGSVASNTTYAEKPFGVGGGRGAEHSQKARKKPNAHFDASDRVVVREYFGQDFRNGNCPPGLAKKRNGCMPPGQAKKWKIGRPLPSDVVIYDLPPELVEKIGLPPLGHKYVRVASDILMIAVGTNMVVEAIDDSGRV